MNNLLNIANENLSNLKKNPYPGRCIIVGKTPDSKKMVQIYSIMGRSPNSKNRIFIEEKNEIKTKAYDESKVEDPSLIIYNVTKTVKSIHILTNGVQTDTIYEHLNEKKTFESALECWRYEPDEPNFTPRISSMIDINNSSYKISILKSFYNTESICQRLFFNYSNAIEGIGHCIHTYKSDGNPLPSFEGEPYIIPIFDSIDETLNMYWESLNEDNKVSLFTKYVDIESGKVELKIINKNI
jgi:hypothetical protein